MIGHSQFSGNRSRTNRLEIIHFLQNFHGLIVKMSYWEWGNGDSMGRVNVNFPVNFGFKLFIFISNYFFRRRTSWI